MRDCWAKLNEERAGAGTGTENKDKISFHNFMNVLYRYSTDISSISMDPFVFWFQLYSGKDKDLPGLASWDHWRVNNLFFHFLSLFFDWGGFQVKVRKAWKFHSPYFCNTRRIHINFGKDKDLPGLAPLTGEQPPLSLFVHFSLKQDFDWGGFQEKPKKAWKFHFLNFWNSWNHEEDILQNVFFVPCVLLTHVFLRWWFKRISSIPWNYAMPIKVGFGWGKLSSVSSNSISEWLTGWFTDSASQSWNEMVLHLKIS